MKPTFALLFLVLLAGCATTTGPHVSKSKQNQVELVTQTGPYAYLHTSGGGPGGGR